MSPPNRPSVTRRGFLAGMAAMSAAVGAFALSARGASAATRSLSVPSAHSHVESAMPGQVTVAQAQDASIRPFVVDVPEADLDDLRRRLAAVRWPDRETVADRSQGAPLAKLQPLVQYWATDYDWRTVETRLNSLPQFVTTIDGLDIHFIHVRSRHPDALPLLITHGWPGSVLEFLDVVGPLTRSDRVRWTRRGRVRRRDPVHAGVRLLR